ncbi:guanylate-binding protein 1-like isoform X2 [Sceloporus undulatus]|uniref:guanylate-binding protein 1-like isoform X2 n=1 Tax=Sceloporus undulatus TaxID=8520 RepID=UPI001C4AC4C7|nr:guanylate-binding protein 1-like isoform X2 [Sceloporus undulatus]
MAAASSSSSSGGAWMPGPLCLVENRGRRLSVCPEALALLAGVRQPVAVVAVVGLYRTGKSYLMNRLAGKRRGFSLGSTVQSQTKGIWIWCLPYPDRPGQTLVLLDTEGLGDVEKGDTQNDTWIFALAVLLSSTLVYNSMGTIDQNAMDQLHYVTELTERIKAKAASGGSGGSGEGGLEDTAEYVRFFPTFIWALRDFTLQLELNGRTITEDEYLENALKLKKGDAPDVRLFNFPRECIRFFFPIRKCFIFDRPTSGKNLHRLEEMTESELDPEFVEQASQFCRYVYWTSKEKTIPGGHVVTGHLLAKLVETYVETIQSGKVPCMESAVLALAEIENTAAVGEAASCYVGLMENKLKLPTETVPELLEIHAECEKEAVRTFMARAFKDDKRHFQAKLMKSLEDKKEEYCRKNERESSKRCQSVLASLAGELEEKVRMGTYSRPSGHKRFVEDLKKIEDRYRQESKKGVMADKALEDFLKSKETVAKSILQTDKALSNKEKEVEAQRAQAEAAQMQQKLLEQDQARLRQMVEDQKRSHEEQLQRLGDKMEAEKRRMKEETDRMMQHKLEEQKKLLEEGFYQKAKEMEGEIHCLKEEKESNSSALWRGTIETVLPQLASLGSQFLQYRMLSNLTTSGNPRNASGAASAPEYPSSAKSTK